jgi:Xaa-Pro aminopeptidase
MNTEIIRRRLGRIRAQLRTKGIDGLILTRPVDVRYVTAFSGEDSWALVTKGAVYLITDSRYTEQAQKECLLTSLVERKDPIAQATGRLLGKLRSVRVAAAEKSISLTAYQNLRKAVKGPLKTVGGIIEEVRSVKDSFEISAIRKAADIAAAALERTLPFIRPGITECELSGIIDLQIRKLGSKNSFETIVAFGPHASRPHHQPTQRILKKRDAVLIDFGAKHAGYCSDITRCIVVGQPTSQYRRAYDAVEKAQTAAIAAARAGVEIVEIDSIARTTIRESGFPVYGHGTGHGLGLEIHETPFLKEKAKGTLQAGQIITIEPGIYLPGKLGVRIEDDILITDRGSEIVTAKCPHIPLPA